MNNNNNTAMYSAGFSWGFKSNTSMKAHQQEQEQVQQHQQQQRISNIVHESTPGTTKLRQKRKHGLNLDDEEGEGREGTSSGGRGQPVSSMARKYMISKKKSNVSSSIQGQPLPIQRGLELMNKEQIQSVLIEIMKTYPQTQQLVSNKLIEFNFSIEECMELLKVKLEQLYGSIPYSRSYEMNNLNDYAFVRMKPYILEFLNCLVDCILDQIPPRVENLHDSLKFLDVCTNMTTHLPRFQLASNNYYYDKCLEQLSYVWCSVIEHIARDVVMAFNDKSLLCNWVEKLEIYNDLSRGMLERPLQLFKSLKVVESDASQNSESSSPASNPFANNSTVADNQ